MTTDLIAAPLSGRALEEYGAERIRNEFFEQVCLLWERRKAEGWTQKQLADEIGRDPAWVSRNLSAPGNWTARTMGAFVQGLKGEVEVRLFALEDPVHPPSNYDAYYDYMPRSDELMGSVVTIDATNTIRPSAAVEIRQLPFQINQEYAR
jgi:transcriptional regulator with XRE-family HTH domain